jgi:hypothetical protein
MPGAPCYRRVPAKIVFRFQSRDLWCWLPKDGKPVQFV